MIILYMSKKKKVKFLLDAICTRVQEPQPVINTCCCAAPDLRRHEDGLIICLTCGICKQFLIDAPDDIYEHRHTEVLVFAYKRLNHFKELLAQVQGKQSTIIPDDVLTKINIQIEQENIIIHDMSIKDTRDLLKQLKLNKYYEHIPLIRSKLGILPPCMSFELEEILCSLFNLIQAPFFKYAPPSRVNFLNYYYVMFKLCEMLGETKYLPYFPMLKEKSKIRAQDVIWELICAELKWTFVPTV